MSNPFNSVEFAVNFPVALCPAYQRVWNRLSDEFSGYHMRLSSIDDVRDLLELLKDDAARLADDESAEADLYRYCLELDREYRTQQLY